jgi:imidazolonepropionase-like amidohydrolase
MKSVVAGFRSARAAGTMPRMRRDLVFFLAFVLPTLGSASSARPAAELPARADTLLILKPARVFDGETLHEGWAVRIKGKRIDAVGTATEVAVSGATFISLPGATLLPGLIEGHSHVLLHPYNEKSWEDQVAHESLALRTARATRHLRDTLLAGFTTLRDLGTEGAGYADVGLKQAVEEGIIPGPRMLVSTRAIVATGSYEPKGYAPEWEVPQGAEEAAGPESLERVVRRQLAKGADWIKFYADYSYGPAAGVHPTFTTEELAVGVKVAHRAGALVAMHATSAEGMLSAILAGADTIEHGDNGTPELFRLMAQKKIALCPTLSVSDSLSRYAGWKPEQEPEPPALLRKRASFRAALAAGVTILSGSDVGVFAHGQNARELVLMVNYGMSAEAALRAATSVAARVLKLEDRIGRVKAGLLADLIAVDGDPLKDILALTRVRMVIKGGILYKQAP